MPQYTEAVLEQDLNSEVAFERSPRLSPEASAKTLLIAKRQAILDRIVQEKEERQKAKLDWRELLKEAEVTLDEARQKLATHVLQQEGIAAQRREATRASLFLKWFAAEGKSVAEITSGRSSDTPPMYKAVRGLAIEVIDPLLEPDYAIDPTVIDQILVRSSASRVSMLQSVADDWRPRAIDGAAPAAFPSVVDDDPNPLAWQADALCAQTDPEAFFPEKGDNTREAKRICASCDVRNQCLHYALENDEHFGIWGGLSERERRKLRRRSTI